MKILRSGIALLLFASACFIVSQDEVARIPSPTNRIDAVLIETNGGATTSFGYRVFLTKPGWHWRTGTEVASLYGAARSEQAYGVNLKWRSPHELAVEYLRAYQERLVQAQATVAAEVVHTTLVAGHSDPTAPPGGMLYNLQGRPDG